MIYKTFTRAEKILKMFTKKFKNDSENFSIRCYENCREQGYKISIYGIGGLEMVFSEHRSSDYTVVYMQKSFFGLSDEDWDSAKYFEHNKEVEVVDYIYETLLKFKNKEIK